MNNIVVIEQVLHGYQNGHHLITSSQKLTDKSKNKMDILSDLSGPEIFEGFNEYYTGYYLPEHDKVVLGYTWYANEMKRPGCVWTHSLLINPKDMMFLSNNINELLRLFVRPLDINDIDKYRRPIMLKSTDLVSNRRGDYNKILYLIWAIWGNEGPSLIPAKSSDEFVYELIYLWMQLYGNLDKNFSFSTGSLAVRRYESEILSLQIMPKQIVRQVSREKQQYKVLHQFDEINAYPKWVELAYQYQQKDNWRDLNIFRNKFGFKYKKNVFFSHLLKLYVGSKADKNQLNIYEGFLIIEQVFGSLDGVEVSNIFMNLYLEGEFNGWISKREPVQILVYLLENKQVTVPGDKLEVLISDGYKIDFAKSVDFIKKYLFKTNNNLGHEMLKIYAKVITKDMLPEVTNMNLDACKTLVQLNPNLARCELLWKEAKVFQQEILYTIGKVIGKVVDPQGLMNNILLHSVENIAYDLYDVFGDSSVGVFVDFLFKNKSRKHDYKESIKDVCRKSYDICLIRINEIYDDLDDYQLLDMLDIIYLCSDKTILFDNKKWILIYNKLSKSKYLNKMELKISILYFSVMMNSSECLPSYISAFVYNILNQSLSEQKFPNEMWWVIEQYLPDVMIHQWDKCKRIRRAFKGKGYKIKVIIDADKDEPDNHLL